MSPNDLDIISLGNQHNHVEISCGATKEIHPITKKHILDIAYDVVEGRDADSPFTSMNSKSGYISEDVRESSGNKEDSFKKSGDKERFVKNVSSTRFLKLHKLGTDRVANRRMMERKIMDGDERKHLPIETSCPQRLLELSKIGAEKIKRDKGLEVLQKIHNRKKDIMLEMSWKKVQGKKPKVTPSSARGIHERLYIMSTPLQAAGKQRMDEITRKIYLRNKTSRFHGEQMKV